MSEFKEIMKGVKNVLLIEPKYLARKKTRAKNYSIALVKIGSYCKLHNINFDYLKLNNNDIISSSLNTVDVIFISSLFTWKCNIVKDIVALCNKQYPEAKTIVGGVYAMLMPEHCKEYTNADYVISYSMEEVDNIPLDYSFVNSDYQIIQLSRGCTKKCKFCGIHRMEPHYEYKDTFKDTVQKRDLLFLDNNLLANPNIDKILDELDELKMYRKIRSWEAVSGVDVDYLLKKPELAKRMKRSGCLNIRIAWDGSIKKAPKIKKALDLLVDAGFVASKIRVFMLYNFDIPFEECEEKRILCYNWGVRVYQCRYIPLNAVSDNFSQRKKQTNEDYYIHEGWTDEQVKKFNTNCRWHFMAIYNNTTFYSEELKRSYMDKKTKDFISSLTFDEAKKKFPDAWNPAEKHI